jgi:arylformamidase
MKLRRHPRAGWFLTLLFLGTLVGSWAATANPALDALPERLRQRILKNRGQREGAADEAWIAHLPPTITAGANLRYLEGTGADPRLTSLDVYRANPAGVRQPVVIFVHGGGMSAGDKSPAALIENKARFFPAHGFVFVSVNYRLAPEVRHPVPTRDVAAAVAYVRKHAAEWGGDPDGIFLIGHSAGAQLVIQLVTDAPLLAEFGVPTAAIRGAVMVDTALYDIPFAMPFTDSDGLQQEIVEMTYGKSPTQWAAASPSQRIARGRVLPPLLLFHAAEPASVSYQATQRFAERVREAGGTVLVEGAREKDHSHLGRDIGNDGDWITGVVMDFLRRQARK